MVAEPVGGSVEGDDDGSVQEPVEHRRGNSGVSEDLAPGADEPVRGDHDRRFQVALIDDLEQGRSGLGWQWQIPEFIALCRYRHSAMNSATSRLTRTPRTCSSSSSRPAMNMPL